MATTHQKDAKQKKRSVTLNDTPSKRDKPNRIPTRNSSLSTWRSSSTRASPVDHRTHQTAPQTWRVPRCLNEVSLAWTKSSGPPLAYSVQPLRLKRDRSSTTSERGKRAVIRHRWARVSFVDFARAAVLRRFFQPPLTFWTRGDSTETWEVRAAACRCSVSVRLAVSSYTQRTDTCP